MDEWYWALKRWYTGDLEFTVEHFGGLPYQYVVDAYRRMVVSQRMEQHMNELPIAHSMALTANLNRDTKKRSKPFTTQEFCMFTPPELKNTAKTRYANAAMALIRARQFPSWALFCYKDLTANANDTPAPDLLSFQAEDVILLAPEVDGSGFSGLLIALESASGQVREMHAADGSMIKVEIPIITTKVIARDEVHLQLI